MPMTTSFATEAHFERFAGRELHHKNEGGTTLGVILTTEQARTTMAVPKTRFVLQTAFSELVENVSTHGEYVKNASSSLEVQTTLAIARNETLRKEYGKLELVNGGQGVLFHPAVPKAGPTFEVDGLVKNSTVLIMNEAKSRLHPDDAVAIALKARNLEFAITHPEKFVTVPAGVLLEVAGLETVVAVAGTSGCVNGALEACEKRSVRVLAPDGSGFAILPRKHGSSP
jgi:hypothetical protein